MENGAFKTDDLTLATLLAIEGYAYSLIELTSSKAIWEFTYAANQEEQIDDLIASYEEFDYKVEPRQFVLKLAEVRRELYAFLPHRRSGAPSPSSA